MTDHDLNPQTDKRASAIPDTTNLASFMDATTPNTTRMFNYLAGGTAHFEVDRQAAHQMLEAVPTLRKWVRLRHAFSQEAAQTLYDEGITQFLDLASGMPTEDHMHAFLPEAHIVYSDINPVAITYGQTLLADLDNVAYIHGNVYQIDDILNAPEVQRLLDLQQKIAIGLNYTPMFLPQEANQQLAQALFEWAPVGSKMFLVMQTRFSANITPEFEKFVQISTDAGLPLRYFSLDEFMQMLQPWQPTRIEPIATFLGLPEDFISEAERESTGIEFQCGFFTKEGEASSG